MFGRSHTSIKPHNPKEFLEDLGDINKEYKELLDNEAQILKNATLRLAKATSGAVTTELPSDLAGDGEKLPREIAGFQMKILNMRSRVSALNDTYDGALVSVKTVDPELDLNNYRPHSFSPPSSQEQAAVHSHDIPSDIKGVVSEIYPDGSFVVDPIGNAKKGVSVSPLRIQPKNPEGEPQIRLKFL